MPIYRFHVVPEDDFEDTEFKFADDDAALETAKVFLRELARKACAKTERASKRVEVLRRDGSIAGTMPAEAGPALSSLAAK